MTSDLLGISITGLKVSQSNLSTAGHNIANAGVEGYSRQRVNAHTNPATLKSGNYVGTGASVESITRIVNQFVTDQLRVDTSLFAGLDTQHSNISTLDGLLADSSTGLSSALESFFAAMQNGADDPTSLAARQLIISESENLADRFNSMFAQLETIEAGINDQLKSTVSQVNALSENIARLNLQISSATGIGNGAPPNDLLDQRDEAIRQLSELVSLQTYEQGNGQINVVIGSGQSLIVGTDARALTLVAGDDDAHRSELMFVDDGGGQIITDRISAGTIGGLITFRDSVLSDTYKGFGRIAIALADTFNQVSQMGVDLNNQFGGLFFYDVNAADIAADRVIANLNNYPPQNSQLSLYIEDSLELTTSDYEIKMISDNLFRVERLSDGEIVASDIINGKFPMSAEFDGMKLVVEGGTFHQGDSFSLQALKFGGRDFSAALTSADEIAFASPLLTDAALGNLGTGVISQGEVVSLTDENGNPLPLLANSGEMNPPLLVRFTSTNTYEILDNSDPGNPLDLDPPIRNQRFVPGISNDLFSNEPGGTMVTAEGELIGLPAGRSAVNNAAIQVAGALASDFSISDFSAANQFSFEVNVTNTVNGINDTPVPIAVTIAGAAITDETTLLQEINSQLATSNVRAVMIDDGGGTSVLAFRMLAPGYGDITLQNYSGPAGPAAADNLFGFSVSTGLPLTTQGNTNGYSGYGSLTNAYPAEAITITRASATAGLAPSTYNIFTGLNASAKATASALSNVPGVSANAFTYVELSNFQVSLTEPLQLSINDQNIIEYDVDPAGGGQIIAAGVPNPQTEAAEFQQYLADRINANEALLASGMYALAARDTSSGNLELRIYSTVGDDINVGLISARDEYLDVGDGENDSLRLRSVAAAIQNNIVVGGSIDVSLDENLSMGSFPPLSMLFGNTASTGFARQTYQGIQASINGRPQAGDTFSLDFNADAASDNRNALRFVNLEDAGTLNGGLASYSQSYGTIVERIGIETSAITINKTAAEQVLTQSQDRRDSYSAVNLDEEAADLIRFEQMFSANAQVISVARELFDRLINSL